MTTKTRKRAAKSPEYAVSDEAAAYIAEALMELALKFESTHFAQIRRHYQSITPTPGGAPGQPDLFAKLRPSEHSDDSLVRPAPRAFFRPDR